MSVPRENIRCLCAVCRAFTDHTVPGGKCTVCDAGIPTGGDLAAMVGRRDAAGAAHPDEADGITTRADRIETALRTIMECRDSLAEGGKPPFGTDQAFDDWAADLASEALR